MNRDPISWISNSEIISFISQQKTYCDSLYNRFVETVLMRFYAKKKKKKGNFSPYYPSYPFVSVAMSESELFFFLPFVLRLLIACSLTSFTGHFFRQLRQ